MKLVAKRQIKYTKGALWWKREVTSETREILIFKSSVVEEFSDIITESWGPTVLRTTITQSIVTPEMTIEVKAKINSTPNNFEVPLKFLLEEFKIEDQVVQYKHTFEGPYNQEEIQKYRTQRVKFHGG